MPWVLQYDRVWAVEGGRHQHGYVYMTWAIWRAKRKRGLV